MSEIDVEAYNRAELWKDAINHLQAAKECLEQAQGILDDLERPKFSQNLASTIETIDNHIRLAEDQRDKKMR